MNVTVSIFHPCILKVPTLTVLLFCTLFVLQSPIFITLPVANITIKCSTIFNSACLSQKKKLFTWNQGRHPEIRNHAIGHWHCRCRVHMCHSQCFISRQIPPILISLIAENRQEQFENHASEYLRRMLSNAVCLSYSEIFLFPVP